MMRAALCGLALAVIASAAGAAPALPPEAEHGHRIAQRECAMCHAIADEARSPNGGAPPFRNIRVRYNPISLERALRRISTQGHFEMRPKALSESDILDVAAYIDALEPR